MIEEHLMSFIMGLGNNKDSKYKKLYNFFTELTISIVLIGSNNSNDSKKLKDITD